MTIWISVEKLTSLFEAMADTFPMNDEEKRAWVEHSVIAELRGNIMQGLEHLGYHWFQRFTDGTTNWQSRPRFIKEAPAFAIFDADGKMGAWVSRHVMRTACERAKQSGVYTIAVRNSPDWMMMSFSTRQALDYDCVGLAFANSRPDVAPWGGTKATYGHCVISAALPAGRHFPLLLDMAANDTGGLQAQVQLMRGIMPQGLYFDADGNPADNPDLWGTDNINWGIKGGAQRMSGYRDLALTAIIDGFAGALTGMKCALDLGVPEPVVDGERTPRGQIVMAFDIAQFTEVAEFKNKIDRAIDQAKSSPLEPGFDEILMPGERGYREEEKRRINGVPIEPRVWADVRDLCSMRGIDANAFL